MSYRIQVVLGAEVHEVGFVGGADIPNPDDPAEAEIVARMVRDWADDYGRSEDGSA
ncbi:hypothetical protein [Amycolatopsis sp. NPDC004079]|uniref:hypothetical protein n=1 Tax=Amycolatopsis sp. NPDC004079 TaxID=3154549 RepID=UPI0033A90194